MPYPNSPYRKTYGWELSLNRSCLLLILICRYVYSHWEDISWDSLVSSQFNTKFVVNIIYEPLMPIVTYTPLWLGCLTIEVHYDCFASIFTAYILCIAVIESYPMKIRCDRKFFSGRRTNCNSRNLRISLEPSSR